MAINWNFNADDYEERSFDLIPVGNHRIRVAEIEEMTSSKGNQMLKFTFDVSGYKSKLFWYLVFLPDNPKITNQNIGDFCESFGIEPPSLQGLLNSKGKVGACRVKHEEYEGDKQARLHYFLKRDKQDSLPPWQEPSNSNGSSTAPIPVVSAFADLDDGDIPF